MMNVSDFPILILNGSARERGRIHGETLRGKIRAMVGEWKENISQDLTVDPDLFLQQLVTETNFLPAVKRWTPHLLEEVKGIAEGSGLDFTTIFARQLSDEEPWFRMEKKLGRSWGSAGNCSALGVHRQGNLPAMVAQNMDTPAYYAGYQVLLHIKYPESPLEVFMFTIAGKINLAGMNNTPVAICCNTVLPLNYARDGLPEDFVVRGALEQPGLQEALAFMHSIKHASGQNYLIGGPKRVLSLECSANKVIEFVPAAGSGRVCHTNHALANDDIGIHQQRMALQPEVTPGQWRDSTGMVSNTHARFDYLEAALHDPADVITPDRIKALLSDHTTPVCFHSPEKLSLGCLIMELGPTPTLHLAPGPPCRTPFTAHTF
jgi:isopenicillin-N N-acyltransferase like protein